MTRFESFDYDTWRKGRPQDERMRVVADLLRALADHVEHGGSPYLCNFRIKVPDAGSTSPFIEAHLLLSEPWGG